MENTEVKEPELDLDDDLLDLDTDLGGELDLNLDMEPAGPDDLGGSPDPGGEISLDDFGSGEGSAQPPSGAAGGDPDTIALDSPDPADLAPQDDLIAIDTPEMSDLDAGGGDLPDLDTEMPTDFDSGLSDGLDTDISADLDTGLGDDFDAGIDDDLTAGLGDDLETSGLGDDLDAGLPDGFDSGLTDDIAADAGDLGDLGGLGGAPDDVAVAEMPFETAAGAAPDALDMAEDEGEITLSDSELGNIVGDEELTKIMDSTGDDIPMGEAAEPGDGGLDDLSSMDDFGTGDSLDSMDTGDDFAADPGMDVPGLDDIGGGDGGPDIAVGGDETHDLSGAEDLTSGADGSALMDSDELAMDDNEPTTLSESEIDNILGDDFTMPEDEPLPAADGGDGIPEVYDLESPDFEVVEGEVPGEDVPEAPEADISALEAQAPEMDGLSDADALAATDDLDFAMDEPIAEEPLGDEPMPDTALPELDDIDESTGLGDDDTMVTLPGEADLGDDIMGDDLADQVVTSDAGDDLVADVPDAISDLDESMELPGDSPGGPADFDGLDMDTPPVAEIDEGSPPVDLGGSEEEIDLLEDVPDETLMDGEGPSAGFDLDDEEDEGPIALSQDELDNIMGDVETEDMPEDYTPGQDPNSETMEAAEDLLSGADTNMDDDGAAAASGDDLFDDFEDEGPIALSEDELSNIVGDIDMDEAEEVEGVAPPSEDDIYQPEDDAGEIVEEDLSGYGEAPIPAAPEPVAEKSAAISPERVDNIVEGTGIAREDMRKMLGYLDGLFDMLPDAAIQAFSKSEYFDLYKNIMNDLDL